MARNRISRKGVQIEVYRHGGNQSIRFDAGRFSRRGFPEIIYAPGKSIDELIGIASCIPVDAHPALFSRIGRREAEKVVAAVGHRHELQTSYVERASMLCVVSKSWKCESHEGLPPVAVVTAGTSDIGIAMETITVLDVLRYTHTDFFDCGIAGMQRTLEVARDINEGEFGVAVVFAGMEGALASVMTSLTDIPVIGVPVSNGYGFGGHGEAALKSMLQSCIPGLAVMNIDNGIGAAAAAISIIRAIGRHTDMKKGVSGSH